MSLYTNVVVGLVVVCCSILHLKGKHIEVTKEGRGQMRGWRVGLIEIVNRRDTSQDKQDNLEITLSQIRTNVKVFAVIFLLLNLQSAASAWNRLTQEVQHTSQRQLHSRVLEDHPIVSEEKMGLAVTQSLGRECIQQQE